MGEGGGKDMRRDVACAVTILCEEKEIIIGVTNVGRYIKLTRADLARQLGFNGSLIEFTRQVGKIRGNNDTLASTLALN